MNTKRCVDDGLPFDAHGAGADRAPIASDVSRATNSANSAFPRESLSTSRVHHWDSFVANPMSRQCLTAVLSASARSDPKQGLGIISPNVLSPTRRR